MSPDLTVETTNDTKLKTRRLMMISLACPLHSRGEHA